MALRPFRSLFTGIIAITLVNCGREPTGPITELPRKLEVAELDLIESDNRFALKLFR